jgi:hypothetical protein
MVHVKVPPTATGELHEMVPLVVGVTVMIEPAGAATVKFALLVSLAEPEVATMRTR